MMNTIHDARLMLSKLNESERAVLAMTAVGWSDRDTARQLNLSPRTIQLRRAAIRARLQLKTRADLIRLVAIATAQEAGATPAIGMPALDAAPAPVLIGGDA